MQRFLSATLFALVCLVIASPASARHRHATHLRHHQQEYVTQLSVGDSWYASDSRYGAIPSVYQPIRERHYGPILDAHGDRAVASDEGHYLPHPAGCPHTAFCGCGSSVRIFGHPVRSLYLAANWLKYPRTMPAPGMVAARHGHVFVIEQVNGDGTVIASDYNSGGHMSRRHAVSLRGYTVVNPNS